LNCGITESCITNASTTTTKRNSSRFRLTAPPSG
jgi:hypothetical protein